MRHTLRFFMAAAAGLLLLATADLGSVSRAADPCQADIQRLCSDVKPGGGRILHCLKAHEDAISPECKVYVQAKAQQMQQKFKTWREACEQDVNRLCADVPMGEGRILNCLKANQDKVSPACRGQLDK